MSFFKKVLAIVAVAAISYFAPGWGTSLAGSLLGAGASAATVGFVGAVIGTVIVAAGSFLISKVLGGQSAPDIDAGKVVVKVAEPSRWLCAGRARQGGAAIFGEFDPAGNFWYVVVHSDSTMESAPQYILDDMPVTLDGSGYVYQKEFRLQSNSTKDPAEFDGQGVGYVQLWTTTYTEGNPTPPPIAALNAAFPSLWTADHKLVGTTFTVVKMTALEIENRSKIYTWRGPFGMGEPAVSIVADWSRMYDPRDPTQTLGNRATYKTSRNPALIWAWWRTHPYGRNKPESSINWAKIAEQANICDQTVVGVYSTQKRYEAGVAFIDSKKRADAETEILLCMDGQLVFDEDGKAWARAGHWEAPTLTLTRGRDIMGFSSMEAQDGESETSGVIVRYSDPDARFTPQPSAAWLNPIYYDSSVTPKFLVVDILGCQNHNQAMRLAKGIGLRSQPRQKCAPVLGLRGLRARQERIITMNYDNVAFFGTYEIATPVELDGVFTSVGLVPINSSRWTLLPGEEAPKPVVDGAIPVEAFPPIIGEVLSYTDNAIRIDFPALPRPDATYAAEYILTSEITGSENDPWIPMSININTALSGPVVEGVGYTVRYRYTAGSGRGPQWELQTITPAITLSPPQSIGAALDGVDVVVTWRNPNDLRFYSTGIWRNTSNNFSTATEVFSGQAGAVGGEQSVRDAAPTSGTYYYWAVAYTSDATASAPTGPASVVVP